MACLCLGTDSLASMKTKNQRIILGQQNSQ